MAEPAALADIATFCRVAEFGHFGRAALALRSDPSSVSRAIKRLEARLGAALFTRTTRRVTLTQEGALYFQQCRQALQQIEDVELAVGGAAGRAVGLLRIAVPTTYGQTRLLPMLPGFQARHPELRLEIHVTNRPIDAVEEGFDCVIRFGAQPDSSLVSRTLETLPIGVFAAPSYLAARGVPASPHRLAEHACIGFALIGRQGAIDFLFREAGRPLRIAPPPGPLIVHDPMGMVALGRAGGGLFQTGHYVVADDLARGTLTEVLRDHSGATRPIVALYPPNRRLSAKLRAFLALFD